LRVAAAEIRGRSLVTSLGAGTMIIGSTGRLSQVFLNLLVNAAQAVADRRDGKAEIFVTTRREGDQVVAEVSNNGPAISAEHLPRIFEPFFTTKNAGMGTGLGLSTSRDIIRRHRGEIRVESSVDAGTRFTLVLPAAPGTMAPRS
jgi:signal transduction histidine kinase